MQRGPGVLPAWESRVAVGKKADLVLLNATRIRILDNITHIDLVINKGKMIDPGKMVQ